MKILCTGDLHLGRRPSRLPSHLEADPRLTVASVWDATVHEAIARGVDAVVLTGDLVDRNNRFFEAWGPLERGLRQLSEAGIPTALVAGNHDYDVLPRLVESLALPNVHLLGAQGQWQQLTLDANGTPLHLVGWSFPRRTVHTSPLDTLPPLSPSPGVSLGVLHADLDQPTSDYAPVRLAELTRQPVQAWLLGHVHTPMWRAPKAGDAPSGALPGGVGVLYPGSLQPLDPGEPGVHGPWLLEVEPGQPVQATQLPLATVRYAPIELSVDGFDDPETLEAHVPAALRQAIGHADADSAALVCVACRLRLTGRTSLHGRLDATLQRLRQDLDLSLRSASVHLEQVTADTRPALDLATLAISDDAVGRLAQLILAIERGELDAQPQLVRQAQHRVEEVHRAAAYRQLAEYDEENGASPRISADDVRDRLLRQGLALLNALVAQKEGEA